MAEWAEPDSERFALSCWCVDEAAVCGEVCVPGVLLELEWYPVACGEPLLELGVEGHGGTIVCGVGVGLGVVRGVVAGCSLGRDTSATSERKWLSVDG